MLTEPVEMDSTTSDDLIIEPLPEVIDEPLEDVPGLETTELETDDLGLTHGLDSIAAAEDFAGSALDMVEEPDLTDSLLDTTDEDLVVSEELVVTEESDAGLADLDLVEEAPSATDLPLIQGATPGASVADLEGQVLDNPDDPELHRQLAEAVLAEGDEPRALEELELGLVAHEAREEWDGATRLVNRLIVIAPDVIRYHQKLVELAYRRGDRAPLLEAYLSLGDALARAGANDKAIAVYGRVREHDPDNAPRRRGHGERARGAGRPAGARTTALPPHPAPPRARVRRRPTPHSWIWAQ